MHKFQTAAEVRFSYAPNNNTVGIISKDANNRMDGCVSITDRDLGMLNWDIPGLTDIVRGTKGKTVFIGNGLSLAPLEIIDMDSNLNIVLSDRLDYPTFLSDLINLRQMFLSYGVTPRNLECDIIMKCNKLVNAAVTKKVVLATHAFGENEALPSELRGSDLVINANGPGLATLHEQIQCLNVRGKLHLSAGLVGYVQKYSFSGVAVSPGINEYGPHVIERVSQNFSVVATV